MPLGLFSRPFSEHDSNDSTRAPLWGATTTNRFPRRPSAVSTHAPLWGATSTVTPRLRRLRRFNPRAPMGRDERMHLTPPPCCEFQPTRPYGARPRGSAVARCPASRFQPTRPYGARRRGCGPIGIRAGFNPRAPMGRDCVDMGYTWDGMMFQPTRPYGARPVPPLLMISGGILFQPTRPYGARHRRRRHRQGRGRFQPTRPYGARLQRCS